MSASMLYFFGLKDWAEILKMYEKDDLYLGMYSFAAVSVADTVLMESCLASIFGICLLCVLLKTITNYYLWLFFCIDCLQPKQLSCWQETSIMRFHQ